jgi:hypothetical protein
MKKEMCKGCWALREKEQVSFFDADGKRLKQPQKAIKPYCCEFELHMDYVERFDFHSGDNKCTRYYNNKMD